MASVISIITALVQGFAALLVIAFLINLNKYLGLLMEKEKMNMYLMKKKKDE